MKKFSEYLEERSGRMDVKLLKKGKQVRVLKGTFHGKLGKIVDWDQPDPPEYPEYQIHVRVGSKTVYLEPEDVDFA